MRYLADDGKIFENKDACEKHEAYLKREANRRDIDYKRLQEKQKRYCQAWRDFCDEADTFQEKYHENVVSEYDGLRSIFDWFFN